MDLLADVLAITRLGSAVLAHAELVAPWGLAIDPIAEAHVHVVQRGTCWLRTSASKRAVRLDEGDVVLIGSGVGHSLSDHPDTPLAPYRGVLDAMPKRLARERRAGESRGQSTSARTTRVLCAKYLFQPVGPHPLAALLPPLVHLRARDGARHAPLLLLVELLAHEASAKQGGSELVVPRLVDTLLVLVVRAWLEEQPATAGGWFRALRDPAIARALGLLHQQPEKPWSVAELARRVAQSRATFARRFASLVGETPVAYLTRWRLCLAGKLLAETSLSLEEIAPRVGYETAAAFSKAFRRGLAMSPGRYRARAMAGASSRLPDNPLRR